MMPVTMQQNKHIQFSQLNTADFTKLELYYNNLSDATKSRFAPHEFTEPALQQMYSAAQNNIGFITLETETDKIIAYAIIKLGYLQHDSERLNSYGIQLNTITDCTFAPSVADEWQGCGIGKQLFYSIIEALKSTAVKRMFLWGGVQSSNSSALNFYKNLGFIILGEFEYYGDNKDMVYYLP